MGAALGTWDDFYQLKEESGDDKKPWALYSANLAFKAGFYNFLKTTHTVLSVSYVAILFLHEWYMYLYIGVVKKNK